MNPIIGAFEHYWQTLRAEEPAPEFKAFRISAVPHQCLPFMVLVGVEDMPRRYLYRLVGERIVLAYGENFTGRYLDEIDLEGRNEKYAADFDRVVADKVISRERDTIFRENGLPYVFDGASFPFVNEVGAVHRIILVLATETQLGGF